MAGKVIVRTAQPGETANARRILSGVTAPTAAPTLAGDGVLLQRNEFVHLFFDVTGTAPVFSVQIWWYSSVSGMWHKGEALNVNDNDIATIEVHGLSRLYLQVTAISGSGTPTLNAWAGLVVPV
jgi:hypothetical protein